jgi:hypothetical protein
MPHQQTSIDLTSPEARSALAKMVSRLFALWLISPADRLALLGLDGEHVSRLWEFENGAPLPDDETILDRVGRLLAIYKSLGLLYPHNEDVRYSWVSQANRALEGRTPLEVMVRGGLAGMDEVRRLLEWACAG